MKVGIDVGGTFTDFLVTGPDGEIQVGKVLSTPEDPSIGLLAGLRELAQEREQSLDESHKRLAYAIPMLELLNEASNGWSEAIW